MKTKLGTSLLGMEEGALHDVEGVDIFHDDVDKKKQNVHWCLIRYKRNFSLVRIVDHMVSMIKPMAGFTAAVDEFRSHTVTDPIILDDQMVCWDCVNRTCNSAGCATPLTCKKNRKRPDSNATCEDHAPRNLMEEHWPKISKMIREAAKKTAINESAAETTPHNYYLDLKNLFTMAIHALEDLDSHAHKWNDNGFCILCGKDGNG